MARYKNLCIHIWRAVSLRRLLISSVLTLSSCAMVLFWTESYPRLYLWSYTEHREYTTAKFFTVIEIVDHHVYQISPEDRLLRAVDKLPFKTMTPSSLLLEDMYFIPSTHKLIHYNNPVIHQPHINCSGSELLLILVPSHPESVRERRAIRETWGSVARGREWPGKGDNFAVKLLFVLGVAEVNLPAGNLQSSETVARQDINTPTVEADSHLTGEKDSIFSHRENKTRSLLTTTANNYVMNSVYEPTGHGHNENFHKFNHFLGFKNVNNNRLQDNLKMRRKLTISRLSDKLKKYKRKADIDTLLLKPDQPTQATTTTHTKTTPYPINEVDIMEEISSFHDIIQFDMIDTYANLTRKIILSLQLLLKTCSTVHYILKVDPDIFVNVPLLATFLSRHGDKNSVYGHIYPNSLVERTGKWAVAETALPISKYPIYAAGNAYVMSTDAAEKIVELASRFPYVLVEDAFITGILASVGQVNRVNVAGFTKWTEPRPDPCDFVTDNIYVGNNFTEYDHRVFWREIIDQGNYRCNV